MSSYPNKGDYRSADYRRKWKEKKLNSVRNFSDLKRKVFCSFLHSFLMALPLEYVTLNNGVKMRKFLLWISHLALHGMGTWKLEEESVMTYVQFMIVLYLCEECFGNWI